MKNRVFMNMDDSVYRVVITTEDWSEGDILLMEQFGEPEIDAGGEIRYLWHEDSSDSGDSDGSSDSSGTETMKTKTLGTEYVRLLHGFPYARGFDSRDYGSVGEAVAAGNAWRDAVVGRIRDAVLAMRAMSAPLPTEEVSEI